MGNYGKTKRPKSLATGKKKRRKNSARSVKVSPAVKNYVDKQIVKKAEPKTNAHALNNQALQIYDAVAQTLTIYDCRQALTTIAQSAGSGGRVGNQIRVTKFNVYGFITLNTTSIASNLYFRIVMLRCREDNITPNGLLGTLFQFGNNSLPPVGNLLDMMRKFNKDFFIIYGQKIALLGSSDGTTSTLAMNNTTGSYMFRFDLMKVFGGKVIYNDTTTTPTNKACYLMFIPCNANGTVVTASQISPYVTTINSEVTYTDD